MKQRSSSYHSQKVQFSALGASALLGLGVAACIVVPFWKCIVIAGAMTTALLKPYRWLTHRFNKRNRLAAALLTMGVFFVAIAPAAIFAGYAASEASQAVEALQQKDDAPSEFGRQRLQDLAEQAQSKAHSFGIELQPDQLKDAATDAARTAGEHLSSLAQAVIIAPPYCLLTLVLLYTFLVNTKSMRQYVCDISPLRESMTHGILHDMQRIATATVLGNCVTALSQALVVGCGLQVVGAPYPLLCALVAIPVSFVPVAGSALVWVPIVIALALSSQWPHALGLLAWCSLGSAINTNVVKPYVVGNRVPMPGMLTFLSILGGVKLLGMTGIVAGPLAIGFGFCVLSRYRSERRGAHARRISQSTRLPSRAHALSLQHG